MIDKNLPEPSIEKRYCFYCGKNKSLKGILIHVPNENYNKDTYTGWDGIQYTAFSMWNYLCQWCRAIETKNKKKYRLIGKA